MNSNFERNLDRVRVALANGYLNEREAYRLLFTEGVAPNDAFLAVKGAVVLNRIRGAR